LINPIIKVIQESYKSMSESISKCFIIMPFSKSSELHTEEFWTNHFENLLRPTIEELGVKAYRVETIREDILKKIITNLVTSPIVLADLTDYNPNVFWELGVRQSFKHNTITIAEESTQLPFDVSAKATIFYNLSNEEKIAQFKLKLKEAIEDCIKNPEKPDSYVLEFISGRGSLYEIMRLEETRRRVEALIIEAQLNQKNHKLAKEIISELEDFSKIPHFVQFQIWRSRCLENLFVNRYIDEDYKFYNSAEVVLRFIENMKKEGPWLNTMTEEDKKSSLSFFTGRLGNVVTKIFQTWTNLLEETYQHIIKILQTMITEIRLKPLEELRSLSYNYKISNYHSYQRKT
jgi:hypothetical protein